MAYNTNHTQAKRAMKAHEIDELQKMADELDAIMERAVNLAKQIQVNVECFRPLGTTMGDALQWSANQLEQNISWNTRYAARTIVKLLIESQPAPGGVHD